ncbi:hypothetical protein DZC30_02325 [Comamonas testosteroni]|uniref:Uncharacterized protein n=1 Tax=Comamonas testosteroni TaxID=285 RepID=A0A373FSW2_COMTE|nr:hypothetical protein [Comamonas testosteroni]RGE46632.1 hypothetical protein DZC30_02325 [Comamonas testosteroni]
MNIEFAPTLSATWNNEPFIYCSETGDLMHGEELTAHNCKSLGAAEEAELKQAIAEDDIAAIYRIWREAHDSNLYAYTTFDDC